MPSGLDVVARAWPHHWPPRAAAARSRGCLTRHIALPPPIAVAARSRGCLTRHVALPPPIAVIACCCRPPCRATTTPLPLLSHRIAALRHWPAWTLHTRGQTAVAMPFMALRRAGHASRTRAHVVHSAGAWASRACRSCPAKAWMSRAHLLCLVSLSLSLSLFLPPLPPSSHAINYHTNNHLHSIHRIHGFTIMSSCCPTPPSFEASTAKLQFWSFPTAVPIRPRPAMDKSSPPIVPPQPIYLHH